MYHSKDKFNETEVLHTLVHYLPSQAPLKDFVHHNTLHAFQHDSFYKAIVTATEVFGYKTTLSIDEFRELYQSGTIEQTYFNRKLKALKGTDFQSWKQKLLTSDYSSKPQSRVGQLRANWKSEYRIDLDLLTQPALFRVLCSYLDQGIAIWKFPVHHQGFLTSIREMEKNAFVSFFKTKRAKNLLFSETDLSPLLKIIVGDEALYAQYLFDQQFGHPGWSGMVAHVEMNPNSLIDPKTISLKDMIFFELLMEIDALDNKFGENWAPLALRAKAVTPLDQKVVLTEADEVRKLWQEIYEWSYYDQVLSGLKSNLSNMGKATTIEHDFQALLCIDDRECSFHGYVEMLAPACQTFNTPGFFGVEFYYKPVHSNSITKQCPAPVTPKYLIKEIGASPKSEKDIHFSGNTDGLFRGLLISQTVGFFSALKLALNIFRPSFSPATSASFRHMDEVSTLTVENQSPSDIENGLQIGFTLDEMVVRVENVLRSIGFTQHFAPLIYAFGHGSTSVNNTHYAGYDCGACSGRPGSVNARVFSFMANHPKVREALRIRGIDIPDTSRFVGGLHDTTRDDITFYDESYLNAELMEKHLKNKAIFAQALALNAKERSRRFETIDTRLSPAEIHEKVKRRSVSLFEPRPELNHATNALCFVGRRELSANLFLDRRAFMNSFDYRADAEGDYLAGIMNAVAPVCGGINLEYFFSRTDNHKLGAGTKLPHNVMGLVGVANGIDGDLRTGLPSQMIEAHDPIRLLVIVEHFPDIVLRSIQKNPATYEWFENDWIHLIAVVPNTTDLYLFRKGTFIPYHPLIQEVPLMEDITRLIEASYENLPVYRLKQI